MKKVLTLLMATLLIGGSIFACGTCGCERNDDTHTHKTDKRATKKEKKKKNWCPKCNMSKKKCPCGKK